MMQLPHAWMGFWRGVMIGLILLPAIANGRVVHFPADRPAGSVKISPPAPAGETKFQRLSFGWPDYGSAQGDVTVPDRCQLLLTVHPRRHPLSPLAQLGPNDVDQLCVSTGKNEPVNFNTEVLPYIKHLTGLKALYLNAITIDTAGIRGLANFPSLRFFQRTSMDAHPKTLGDSDLALFRKLKSLEILYVSSERITDAGMAYLGEIKSLRELTVNATNIKGPGFAELARLPALEFLSPSGFGFDDSRLTYLKPLTNIKRLDLGNPHNKITDAGLATIATMRNIEEIDLHWNDKITDAGVAHLASMPALKSLDIHNARLLTAKGAASLGKITTLEELDLPSLNDASAAELRNLHHLKSLKSGNSSVTDAGMEHLENLSNLEELWIGGQFGDAGMNSLAKCAKLKNLFITSAPNLTDKGLANLGTLKSLTELRLPHDYGKNPKLTIGGLNRLNACTGLRLLDARNIRQDGAGLNLSALAGLEKLSILMERNSQLTDRDLASLGNLTRLQELDLRGFPESDDGRSMDITDAGLVHLGNLSSLNRLTITGGPNLTDAGISNLAGLKRLTSLDIGGNFTDGALSRLGATVALRGLYSLRISGDFTSDGLLALAPMKMMTRLDLKTGRHLDPAAVKRLQTNLPLMFGFNVQGDRALPTPKVSPKLLSPSAALTEPRPAGRVVHFPTDRPLGRVSISISKEKDPIFSDLMEVAGQNGGEFEFIDHGPVKGDVFVPAGQQLQLEVDPSVNNLKDLELLGPNDIDRLKILCPEKKPVVFESTVLPHILHLKSLKALDLTRMKIEGPGLRHLKAFPSLHTLRFFTPGSLQDADLATLKDLKNLQILRITGMITDYGMPYIAQIKSLRKLYLMTTRIQGPGLAELAKHPGLDYLEIYDEKSFDDRKLSYLRGASIRHLGIGESTTRISNSGLAMLHSIRNLENVDLHFNDQITDAGVENLRGLRLKALNIQNARLSPKGAAAVYSIPTLEYLTMPNLNITNDMFVGIENLKNLKFLRISGSSNSPLTDAALRRIEGLSNLEQLSISGRGITDAGMDSIARLLKLKILHLWMAPQLTDAGVAKLATIKTLTELTLPLNNSVPKNLITGAITFNGVNQLNNCSELRILESEYVHHGNATLNISGLTKLESLRLRIKPGATWRDEDLACLSNLTNLNRLIIENEDHPKTITAGLSNSGVSQLANLNAMGDLVIPGGPNMTDEGLDFMSGMSRLHNLTLSGNFTDAALRRIGAMPSLRGLQGLTISGNFTSAGLQYLQPMKSLWALNVKTPNHFDPAAVKQLHSKLPVVMMFNVQGDRKLPQYQAQPVVRTIQPMHAFAPQPTPTARIVHFPTDRPLGHVKVSRRSPDALPSKLLDFGGRELDWLDWLDCGAFKGDLTVPAGQHLMLIINPSVNNLKGLELLGPNDIDRLTIQCPDKKPVMFESTVLPHIRHMTGLKELSLTSVIVNGPGLKDLKNFPSLRVLGFTSNASFQEADLAALKDIRNLESLGVWGPLVSDYGMPYIANIKTLRKLFLCTANIKGPGLAHLAKHPGLDCLDIHDTKFFGDRKLSFLRGASIKKLGIGESNTKISNAGLAMLHQIRNLEDVDLHFNNQITDAGVENLRGLRLKSLDIMSARITPRGAAAIYSIPTMEKLSLPNMYVSDATLAGIENLKNLKFLQVAGNSDSSVTDAGLRRIAQLSNLEELHIGGLGITDAGLDPIVRLPKLNSLTFFIAPKLTDMGLAKISTIRSLNVLHLPAIELSRNAPSGFTIAGINQLNNCPEMRRLDTGRGLVRGNATLNLSRLGKLEWLRMTLVANATWRDEDLAGLAQCASLNHLTLKNGDTPKTISAGIGNAGVNHLAGLKSLCSIELEGGPGLTDDGVGFLAGMNKLSSLRLTGNFSDGALRRIGAMPSLRALSSLTISGNFTTAGLQSMQPMKSLWSLDIKTPNHIDPVEAKRLYATLPNIGRFNIQGDRKLPQYQAQPAVRVIQPMHAFAAPQPTPSARVLHFPKNRSLGTVSILDENFVEKIEPYFYSPNAFTPWEKLGRAQGDVVIPPGKKAKLMLGRTAARDLSPLAMLGPNDLNALEWGGCVVEPSDHAIECIARLTGLKELNLAAGMLRTNGTDPCPLSMASFAKIRAMPSLVSLKTPYHMTNEQFAALAGMTRLKRLDVQSNRFSDRALSPLATMTGLEQLAVGGERLTDAGIYYIAGLRLTHLRLWGNAFRNGALAHIKNIRTIKSLSIFHHQITDAGLAQLSGMTQLEQLHAGYTKITNAGLVHLKPLRNLKTLGLGDTMITDDGLVHLKDMTSLEVLGLNGGNHNKGKGVTGRGLPHLANLKNLKSLTINSPRNTPLGDAEIRNLLGFSRLEELHFWGTCIATDQGMADLAKLSSLKSLNLGLDAPRITNRGLAHLAKLSRLERLELGGANGITISGLNALNGLTTLKVLNAGYCFKWKIDGDKPLDISGLKNLEELSLTSARDEDLACLAGLTKLNDLSIRFQERLSPGNTISDRGLQHLAGLTSMKRLSIGGPGVTDAGLSNFARMKNLEYLLLQGYFTNAGLAQLQQFKNLWSININSGSSVTPSAIQHLRASLPEVALFNVAGDKKLPKGKTMTTSNTLVEPAPPVNGNGHPRVGRPAPDFTATTIDGKEFKLSDQRGKVVVLHFWATWCAPCIKSSPSLKKLQDELKARFGDKFVWVDLSLDDYERNVIEHVKKYDLKSVQIRLGGMSRIAADYGVKNGVPDDFMIGPDGTILLNRESPQVDTATAIANALRQ